MTHGHTVNISGQLYKSIQYTLDPETEMLNFDEIERLAQEHKPKLIIAGASAYYFRIIDFKKFADIAHSVGAPVTHRHCPYCRPSSSWRSSKPSRSSDYITSTTHKTLRGPRGGLIMCKQEFAQTIDAPLCRAHRVDHLCI